MITSVITIGLFESVDASHGTKKTFASGTIDYKCYHSLNSLDTEWIIPCTELGKAATTWTSSVSSVTFQNTTSATVAEVKIKAGNVERSAPAKYQPNNLNSAKTHITLGTITFSAGKDWGTDSSNWWHNVLRFDFQTIALHELEHALGLDHDNNSSLMKSTFATWDIQRTVPTHDMTTVRGKF